MNWSHIFFGVPATIVSTAVSAARKLFEYKKTTRRVWSTRFSRSLKLSADFNAKSHIVLPHSSATIIISSPTAIASFRSACGTIGGRAATRGKSVMEDEDPYYARKRVGAFAFKTKPRGKAHK